MNINPEHSGKPKIIFDLEKEHDKELLPLIRQLCDKAKVMGFPIFIVTCYKTDQNGAWIASSARGRDGFVPEEFLIIRALVEGRTEIVNLETFVAKLADTEQ